MASTTLTRTPASGGNQKTWTLSSWVKNSYGGMFFCVDSYGASKSLQSEFYQGSDFFAIAQYTSGSSAWGLTTNRLFRDRNAWYHLVISVDTTQATESDRVKIYINGVQETSFSTATYPSLNYDTGVNSTLQHMIGNRPSSSTYFDGSMSHFHFIDGTAYDASTFGETDATTGIWKPITEPSVTYGTNGFFLKFENSGSMGLDSSPNGNNFTVNGNLTQTVDTPSNVFATLNYLIPFGDSYSNGNNTHTTSSSDYRCAYSTLGVSSGKYYIECKMTDVTSSQNGIGIANQESGVGLVKNSTNKYLGQDTNDVALFVAGNLYRNGSIEATYGSISANDIVQIALDVDNGYIYWGINGTWQNSANPVTGTGGYAISNIGSNGTYFFGTSQRTPCVSQINFGNGYFGTTPVSSATSDESGLGIFEYTVPSGYYALCTKNINTQEYA